MVPFKYNLKALISTILCCVGLATCIDPIEPDFQFEEGLIFIEGFASTEAGVSFVSVNESAIEFGNFVVNFLGGASVVFNNVDTGESIALTEINEAYEPPLDFRVDPGERWQLEVLLPDGRSYISEVEVVQNPVPITNLDVEYDPELEFREVFGGSFLPGHALSISFDDPPNQDNYYYWTYRGFENLDFCARCTRAVFRDGRCQALPPSFAGDEYFDYLCETDCWRIRFPESIAIFSDEFTDGRSISNLALPNLLLYTREDILVQVQQFSVTQEAFEYYEVLKDIIDDNSGLNAPPPAALIGNLSNPNDSEEFVLGRFTAVATTLASVFIDRTLIPEEPLETQLPINLEPTLNSTLPPPPTTTAPCLEGRFRTSIPPPGWIEQ